MSDGIDADAYLNRIAALAERLPEVSMERSEQHATFRVARKHRLAWFLNDHHGDGMLCLCVKVDPEEKELLIDHDPEKYLRPAYVSRFGWLSIRLDHLPADWAEIESRLAASYRIVAPKRLGRLLDA